MLNSASEFKGSSEYGNKPSGSIMRREVLECLHSWIPLKQTQLHRVRYLSSIIFCVTFIAYVRQYHLSVDMLWTKRLH
jgi:hypothetical protein